MSDGNQLQQESIKPAISRTATVIKWNIKVGSHDPIFASNYSLAHFFRQQLDVWTPIFDKFPAVFVIFIQLDQKNRQFLIFTRSILLNIF